MPDRQDHDGLLDILDEANVIAGALKGVSYERFAADPVLQRAILYALQTIGEAANHLSEGALERMPGTPWSQVRGMRNRIVHGYFGLDMAAVWRTAVVEAPALALQVRESGLI